MADLRVKGVDLVVYILLALGGVAALGYFDARDHQSSTRPWLLAMILFFGFAVILAVIDYFLLPRLAKRREQAAERAHPPRSTTLDNTSIGEVAGTIESSADDFSRNSRIDKIDESGRISHDPRRPPQPRHWWRRLGRHRRHLQ